MSAFLTYHLTYAGASDRGYVRETNEDVLLFLPEQQCCLISDGIGGHAYGGIAAQKTVSFLAQHMQRVVDAADVRAALLALIADANAAVHETMRQYGTAPRGATLCCLFFVGDNVWHAHLGDSRIYRYRNGSLVRLTRDHTMQEEYTYCGPRAIDPILSAVVTRAIGIAPQVDPVIHSHPFEPGDIYLLCSDGLSDALPEEEIQALLHSGKTLETAAKLLVQRARYTNGKDNITVGLVRVHDETTHLS